MADIHETAIVSPGANLPDDIVVGPYAIIGPRVSIGEGSSVGGHTLIEGETYIGKNAKIYSHAVIGTDPQDLKFGGEHSTVHIGDSVSIREFVTINRGTEDREDTRIGNNCLLMAYAHVAHDCIVGNDCILANCGTLGGHSEMEDYSVLGGFGALLQFHKIGAYAFIGGFRALTNDVPPYVRVGGTGGTPNRVVGVNVVGLQRRGVEEAVIERIKEAYNIFFRQNLNTTQALERIESEIVGYAEVDHFVKFIKESEHAILRSK